MIVEGHRGDSKQSVNFVRPVERSRDLGVYFEAQNYWSYLICHLEMAFGLWAWVFGVATLGLS